MHIERVRLEIQPNLLSAINIQIMNWLSANLRAENVLIEHLHLKKGSDNE